MKQPLRFPIAVLVLFACSAALSLAAQNPTPAAPNILEESNMMACVHQTGGIDDVGGTANDIAGKVWFGTSGVGATPNGAPGAGSYIKVRMNRNYGGSQVPVVVISPDDAPTALADPYAKYVLGSPDYIEIGLADGANVTSRTIYTINYHVIEVQ